MRLKVKVSGVFQHYEKPLSYARVFLFQPSSLFFLSAKFLRIPYEEMTHELFIRQGKEIPLYVRSFDDIPICLPSDRHNYRRSAVSRWTINVPYFDVEFPSHLGSVEQFVTNALSTLASNYKAESDCGANYASWLKVNKESLYKKECGVNGQKRKMKHDQFGSYLQKRLVKAFEQRRIEWNVPLDSCITYGHIKEWLSDTLGYNHWIHLPQHLKGYILSSSGDMYPDWDEIEIKPLREGG